MSSFDSLHEILYEFSVDGKHHNVPQSGIYNLYALKNVRSRNVNCSVTVVFNNIPVAHSVSRTTLDIRDILHGGEAQYHAAWR